MSKSLLHDLNRAFAFGEQVVAGIAPADRGNATPCAEYDVDAMVGHLASGTGWYARIPAEGISDPSAIVDADLRGLDLLAVYRSAATTAMASWSDRDLDRVFPSPMGAMPGSAMAGYMVMELLGHGMDLALATGQRTRPDDDLVRLAMTVADGMGEGLRAPKMMGPAIAVGDDAPLIDQLLGVLGRDPAWNCPTTG